MKRDLICLLTVFLFAAPAISQPNTGIVKGHIRFMGNLPGSPAIRMGVNPVCSKINAGKQVVQEIAAADIKGNLANVFVTLQGNFPQAA